MTQTREEPFEGGTVDEWAEYFQRKQALGLGSAPVLCSQGTYAEASMHAWPEDFAAIHNEDGSCTWGELGYTPNSPPPPPDSYKGPVLMVMVEGDFEDAEDALRDLATKVDFLAIEKEDRDRAEKRQAGGGDAHGEADQETDKGG